MTDLSLLDESVAELLDAAAGLPVEDLMVLLAAENAGKTRKNAVAGLEDLLAAQGSFCGGVEIVENVTEATTVHIGDGRRLAPGESAEVAPEVAAILVASELCR
jgi:hypothetical protein